METQKETWVYSIQIWDVYILKRCTMKIEEL